MRFVKWHRISAVANKEWRLNLRYPMEYIAGNVGGPIKTALFMCFIYSGFLRGGNAVGSVNRDNFQIYVLLGGTLHSMMVFAISVFRQRMVNEKFWQTATATFISPVNMLEVTLGFLLGSCSVQLATSVVLLALLSLYVKVSLAAFGASIAILLLVMLFGFGVGIIGATVSLCFEGMYFICDYAVQFLVFFSCFYYPIEIFPRVMHPLLKSLPSYQMVALLQSYYTAGAAPANFFLWMSYFTVIVAFTVAIPAIIFDFSIKKYGVTGY